MEAWAIKSNNSKRLGIMGGTFDPIHNGHLVAASEAAEVFNLEKVLFVPSLASVDKSNASAARPEHRYLMSVIATAANPIFIVSRVDLDRGGITYTIDTLQDIKKQYPDYELYFITGADAVSSIESWKNYQELFSLAHFVAVTRPDYSIDKRLIKEYNIQEIKVPAMAISSTDCRQRAKEGKPIWYLVPDGVVQYINKHNVY
ncbi:MAG: nicotinate-nucleotide adenylyltransferase [Bifidobacteriaceae bacterium]|jgi:nicotinate-nucleotide adenylyltransferase|nr:nicotinate-nucleotide adenylyltransferase [Bifidobacteriaceae bacterium]